MSFAAWLKSFKQSFTSSRQPSLSKQRPSAGIRLNVELLEDRLTPSTTWFVNPDASGNGAGTDWSNAFTNLPSALGTATAGDQIWVAKGTYSAASGSFSLPANVAVYGGFDGTETLFSQRNFVSNPTILDGGGIRTVVVDDNVDDTSTVLDGFTVQHGGGSTGGGMRDGPGSRPTVSNVIFTNNSATFQGGGMYNRSSSPTVTNVTFINNFATIPGVGNGGGMANWDFSSPTLTNVTFSNNSAGASGGGIFNFNKSSPSLLNVTFSDNSAYYGGGGMSTNDGSPILTNVMFIDNFADPEGGVGGGMANALGSPTLTNVLFFGNSAYFGGGMGNSQSSPAVKNATFASNSGTLGGAVYNDFGSSPILANSILWGDTNSEIYNTDGTSHPAVTYSDVQGGYAGTGNIGADPLFVNAATGDLHLQAGSPAIDTGTNTGAPITDLEGNPRPVDAGTGHGNITDMGAYEKAPAVIASTVTVMWTDGASTTYNGHQHGATASWSSSDGAGGTLPVSYYLASDLIHALPGAPTNAGSYVAVASFPGDLHHFPSSNSANFTISKAVLTGDATTQDSLNMAKQGKLTITISNVAGLQNGESLATFLSTADFYITVGANKYVFIPTGVTTSGSSITITYTMKNSALAGSLAAELADNTSGSTAVTAGFYIESDNYTFTDSYLTKMFSTIK